MNWRTKTLEQRLTLYSSADTLPPDLEKALQANPDLKQRWEQSQRLTKLLSLKQYERPDPDVASRCRSSVIRQLRSIDQEERYPVIDWGWDGVSPAFRMGLAALFVAFIGLQLMSDPSRSSSPTQQADLSALPFQPQPAQAELRRPASVPPTFIQERNDFSAMLATNWVPRAPQPSGPYRFIGTTP